MQWQIKELNGALNIAFRVNKVPVSLLFTVFLDFFVSVRVFRQRRPKNYRGNSAIY